MFNPLVENVRELKDSDLENKIQELSRKYHMASRLMSGSMPMQIAVVLESYREELARRQAEAMKVLAQKSDKNLEGLIKKN